MLFFESRIVFDHFAQCNRRKSIDVRTSVEHLGACGDKWPEIRIGVVVNMAVHHEAVLVHARPGHHGIVTECGSITVVRNKQHRRYAFKPNAQIHFLHPILVVVADNQMLFSFQLRWSRFKPAPLNLFLFLH